MRTSFEKDKMACGPSAVLTFLCIVIMHLNSANGAVNIYCHILEEAFPNCECADNAISIYPTVDCGERGLEQVPTMKKTYDRVIYKLILKNNTITSLTDASFQGLKIENLDLSGNSLVSVESNTFLSMKDVLRTLEIDGDLKSSPPIHALKILNVIQSLTMRNYNVPNLEQNHQYFLSFIHLKSLTLDNWNIQHIEGSSFLGLNQLESLTLLNQKLENLPVDGLRDDPFDSLETLHISNNPIKKVTYDVFSRLSKLKKLDLSNNQIEELEESCFLGVKDTLQNINLHGNHLTNNGKLLGLSGMEALEQLDFSNNLFKAIPSMQDLGVKKPFNLIFNKNKISEILENSFQGYSQYLKDLDLSSNDITNMHNQSFRGATLTSIYLQSQVVHSDLLRLPISLTNSASTLQTMDLSDLTVDTDNMWNVVKELTSLVTLKLNSIQLGSIPDNTFEKVTALEHIDLGYNSLSEITQKSFAGARQLKTLILVGNQIKTIPSCLFHGFLSSPIKLSLALNPIICDCKIKKLLEDFESDRIEFDDGAKCLDGTTSIASIKPENLGSCNVAEEQSCIEYYTTTTPVPTEPVTDPDNPKLELRTLDVGIHTVKIRWTITDDTGLEDFKFYVSSTNSVTEFSRDNIPKSERVMEATGLPANTHVTLCVIAYFQNRPKVEKCQLEKTESDTTPNKQDLEDEESDSAKTGIIVGCVVAGVALIGIVIAVVILLVFRKKPKQVPDSYRPPTQPRSFAKAELPSMSDESRTFAKPKKNGHGPRTGNMQVVAISDGQTSPGPRVGRVNMMFQPEDGYEPMKHYKKKNGGSMYENDHGALPPTPGPDQDSRPPSYPGATGGYYNQGYNEDKYDEIEVEI